MSVKEEWLRELRQYNVDGQPASGPYVPKPQVLARIVRVIGIPIIDGQSKADWRETIEEYFALIGE